MVPYPCRNFGIGRDVIFISYPNTAVRGITAENAISKLCSFAKERLNLTGGATCP
jgi:hypothetical protein